MNPETVHEDRKKLCLLLLEVEPKAVIGYEHISQEMGKPVTSRTPALRWARASLEAEGIVFKAARGLGLRRLDDTAKVDESAHAITLMHGAARRNITRLRLDDYDALPYAKKQRHQTNLLAFQVIEGVTTQRVASTVEPKIMQIGLSLPLSETLKAFGL